MIIHVLVLLDSRLIEFISISMTFEMQTLGRARLQVQLQDSTHLQVAGQNFGNAQQLDS